MRYIKAVYYEHFCGGLWATFFVDGNDQNCCVAATPKQLVNGNSWPVITVQTDSKRKVR